MTDQEKTAKRNALLAKALKKNPKDVVVTPEPKEEKEQRVIPAKKKDSKKKNDEPSIESYHNVKLPEKTEDNEDIEIVEVKPVKGKKVIAQNSEQAEKILLKEEQNQKELEESIAADQARTAAKEKAAKKKEAAKAKKDAAKTPVDKKFSEMTPEEQTARRKEISAKALTAKRAKKAAAEKEVSEEVKAPEEVKCPHAKHDLEFGTDAEEYDVCDNCPLLKKCIAKRDEEPAEIIPVKRVRKNPAKEETTKPSVAGENGDVIPEGMTGAELKRGKKAEKKAAKAAAKADKSIGRTRTNKPAKVLKMTRSEVIGMVLKDDPDMEADDVIEMADAMFAELAGIESNIVQTQKYYTFAINFLKGYNA